LTEATELERPARPVSIEAGAAILIVGGGFGLVQSAMFDLPDLGPDTGIPAAVVVGLVLDLVSIALGVFLRRGRYWVVCLNLTALYAFLYLSSFPNPLGIVLGLADLYVVGVISYHRRWFDAMRAWRASLPLPTRPVR
jgi:hypothetical protein